MSVYKVIDLIGTSTTSWEDAATSAVKEASKTLRDLRVAEVTELDIAVDDSDPSNPVMTYRAKISLSFKYEGS